MKWLVWLLILLNVVLFGYFKLSEPQPPGMQPGHEPIQSESLKILTPEQLAALPQPPPAVAAPAAPPLACYEWGSFPAGSVPRARNILDKFGLGSELRVIAPQEAVRYWVYIPPRRNMQAAQARVNELAALGVQESFVVQEQQLRYAISLGVFRDEASASRLAEEVRSRGVKDVVQDIRNQEAGQSVFLIKNVTAGMAEEIGKLRPDFPHSELRPVACQ